MNAFPIRVRTTHSKKYVNDPKFQETVQNMVF